MNIYGEKMRLQWAGAIFLAMVAGYLDGYGLLFLKTYVSFMSGNTTSTGVMSGSGDFRPHSIPGSPSYVSSSAVSVQAYCCSPNFCPHVL